VGLGFRDCDLSTVYNGVGVECFHPEPGGRAAVLEEFGIPPDHAVVVFLSAFLLPWKRPEIALDVCRILRERGVPFTLIMCGTGPLRAELETEARTLGIADALRWPGQYPQPHRLLQAATASLHTSVGEAFGNVLAEAMACGVPIVATRSGATPEVIDNYGNGLLVAPGPGEVPQLAAAVEKLIRDPRLSESMGIAGTARAQYEFPVKHSVRRTLDVCASLSSRVAGTAAARPPGEARVGPAQ